MTKSGMELSGELTSTGTSLRKHLEHPKDRVLSILFPKVISTRENDQPVGVKQGVTATVEIFWLRCAIALWGPSGDGEKGEGEQEQGGGDGPAHPQGGSAAHPQDGSGHRLCLVCHERWHKHVPSLHASLILFVTSPLFQATFAPKQRSIGFR